MADGIQLRLQYADVTEECYAWFASRGISAKTVDAYGIKSSSFYSKKAQHITPAAAFPYKNGYKLRSIHTKDFVIDGVLDQLFVPPMLGDLPEPGTEVARPVVGQTNHDPVRPVICEGECLHPDTELLTVGGWVNISEYNGGRIAQWDKGGVSFVNPSAIVRKQYSGNLLLFSGKNYSSCLTPGHRFILNSGNRVCSAQEVFDFKKRTDLTIPLSGILDGPGIPLSNEQIAFCLAISADASIDFRKSGKRYMRVGLKKARKINRFRDLLGVLGIRHIETIQKSCPSHTFFGGTIPEWVPGRILPVSWIAQASAKQREFILEELINWDGNRVAGREQHEYSSKHIENAEWVNTLAHTSGLCGSIIERKNSYGEWYKVSILLKKKHATTCLKKSVIPHDGMVYCVTVDSGAILIRHNRKISVTGNCDAMSFYEAGIRAWSIPHGAINPSTKIADGKLDVLSSLEQDELSKGVVIATDSDEPGISTGEEIARRLGKDISFLVSYPLGLKDANDVLVRHGVDGVKGLVQGAKPYPISGLWDVGHFESSVKDLYIKGLGKGLSTGYACIDDLYTISPGQLTVVTGVPSSGKSELVDQLMVNLATNHNWRFAVASFENPPALHIAKLASKKERKPFFTGPTQRMNEAEFDRSMAWVRDHFYFIHDDHGDMPSVESIIEKIRMAVKRHGIRGAVIDPWNMIARPPGDISETQHVSEVLSKLTAMAKAVDIHIWLVAHPAKMMKGQDGKRSVPSGYDISGSAHFYNKADMGITVHRPDPMMSNDAEVHVWKCRFSWLGKQGIASLVYNPASWTYEAPVKVNRDYGLQDWDID